MKLQVRTAKRLKFYLALAVICLLMEGCSTPNGGDSASERLRVVATTNIVTDVVRQVGGEQIDLVGLIPTGADPHSFNPTPQDLVALNDAHVIFINGLHLEEALDPVLDNLDGDGVIVAVNDGVDTIATEAKESGDHDHGDDEGIDPHTWFSIRAVEQWTENIERTLSALDPTNAQTYADNAEAYRVQLGALDAELVALIAGIPDAQRKLVTDHGSFNYLARDYGFEMIGTVIPGLSTMASPSARDLAALQQQIEAEEINAIFVGVTVNPALAEQIAADTGVQAVPIYTGSLSDEDGPAATYVDFMRYDMTQIAEALK